MFNATPKPPYLRAIAPRSLWIFTFTLLAIEFLDELVFGAQGALMPTLRTDLALTYAEVGLLLSLPKFVSTFIEPAIGILGHTGKRKAVVLGGGLAFALALALVAAGQSFLALLIAFAVFNPASGAFVSLSQATLMDVYPARHEQMMARWTLAGSIGVVAGPIAVSAALALNLGWRGLFAAMAVLTLMLVWLARRQPDFNSHSAEETIGFREGVRLALRVLRDRNILRWLALLETADLMLDIFLGFVALYFVDVVRVSEAEGALAVGILSAAGLIGDVLIIPLLERVRGLSYLRGSAVIALALYIALLIVPGAPIKFVLVGLLGLSVSGWYAVLKGQLYSSMPGQSAISMAVGSLASVLADFIPLTLGIVAEAIGLPWAMALLAIGPISLMVGLPRGKQISKSVMSEQ